MTRRTTVGLIVILGGLLAAGCGTVAQPERNAFLALTETFGLGAAREGVDPVRVGAAVEVPFRNSMTVTFSNNHPAADVLVAFVAWVSPANIRTADQQDALLEDGYVQLAHDVRLGTAFVLPVGTLVYNGTGTAGATIVRLGAAESEEGAQFQPRSRSFTLIAPDAVLAFLEPPVSCESVAFMFTDAGFPLDAQYVPGAYGIVFEGATGRGGAKTLAQIETYQCDPLRPGLFLKIGRGAVAANEYFEGENVLFEFNPTAVNGKFVRVTIEAPGS